MLKWAELDIEICSVVRNGQQLEEAIAHFKPDLVISDIKMPIKTGLEVLEVNIHVLGVHFPQEKKVEEPLQPPARVK